jgi:hypothetical protein
MLMILCEGSRADDVSPGGGLAGVDVDDGDDAGGAGFDDDASCLVELVVEDVLVVGEGDDELDDELAAAGHHCAAGSPVGVFPVDAVVLLVETDGVLGFLGGAVCVCEDTVEVLGLLVEKRVSLGWSVP